MTNENLYSENHEATYCPEDDKLRLYVGRVDREEYLDLKKEGWKSTPKQDCDFVATWTTSREDTALSYAGVILDEDQGPADRAADRAERFGGYLDKRRAEAHGHADSYDAGPCAHGYQNQQKAERAAARHDRQADRACNAWSKAEYWQRRTAGVISNALYKSTPSVRMGRIKKLESEQRKHVKSWTKARKEAQLIYDIWEGIAGKRGKLLMPAMWQYTASNNDIKPEEGSETLTLEQMRLIAALGCVGYRSEERKALIAKTKTPEAVALEWLEQHPERPADFVPAGRWFKHNELRLAYENQMLEAAGGRAGDVEMVVGGFVNGHQIHKVNKSRETGRVVSVTVLAPTFANYDRNGKAYNETDNRRPLANTIYKVERLAPEAYRAPTAEELADFKLLKQAAKAAKPKIPQINPTPEEAQRLQDRLNSDARGKNYSTTAEMTQAQFSARSRGNDYLCLQLFDIDGERFKVRTSWGMGANSVIVLTDKPQKKLPAFADKKAPVLLSADEWKEVLHIMRPRSFEDSHLLKPEEKPVLNKAAEAGIVSIISSTQYNWTEAGAKQAREKMEEFEKISKAGTEQRELFGQGELF